MFSCFHHLHVCDPVHLHSACVFGHLCSELNITGVCVCVSPAVCACWRATRLHGPLLSYSLVPQDLPGRLDVRIQVLLGGLAGADSVARVVVGEHVAVDPGAEADVEAAHLPQVHGVTVGEEQRVPAVRGAAHKHASHPVTPAAPGAEHLHSIELPLGVLPVRPLREVEARRPVSIGVHRVRGLRREEG